LSPDTNRYTPLFATSAENIEKKNSKRLRLNTKTDRTQKESLV